MNRNPSLHASIHVRNVCIYAKQIYTLEIAPFLWTILWAQQLLMARCQTNVSWNNNMLVSYWNRLQDSSKDGCISPCKLALDRETTTCLYPTGLASRISKDGCISPCKLALDSETTTCLYPTGLASRISKDGCISPCKLALDCETTTCLYPTGIASRMWKDGWKSPCELSF